MLTVMKFGGSSVADLEHIRNVANRCIAKQREGSQVVVVLSAMGKTTDNLIATAKQITEQPSRRELDMLLTTGEQVSVSLMAMTLISMGVSAVSLNAWQVPMHTTSNYQNARFKRSAGLEVCSTRNVVAAALPILILRAGSRMRKPPGICSTTWQARA